MEKPGKIIHKSLCQVFDQVEIVHVIKKSAGFREFIALCYDRGVPLGDSVILPVYQGE